jgi:hypothetical protein
MRLHLTSARCESQHPHLFHHRPFGVGTAEVEDPTSLHGASLPGWEMLGEKPWKNMGKTVRVNGEIIKGSEKYLSSIHEVRNSCMYEVNHSIRWLSIYPSDHFLGLHPLIFQRFTRW